jgi:Caspase domain
VPAAAQSTKGGENYALLVGSNEGGPGQRTLRYAEQDTERVAQVLTELGGYPAEHIERLLHPTAGQLLAALERVRARTAALSEQGVQTRFFFYYSGHARADALSLGAEPVPLPELRKSIEALPATLSIVVLDACQSGAFSRTKGASQAADFSFNSVERLNTAGIAVVASSNERELSQESEVLRSSYFTHHWLVGLRGAGDHDRDGRVTLSEAYLYAYNHTLANTAQTAVGEQHATLETNLRGQDEIALTQPSAASARLRVPARIAGRLLLQVLPSWSVVAELDKVRGEPVTLALPEGEYSATLRREHGVVKCSLTLRDGAVLELDESQCRMLESHELETKGEQQESARDDKLARKQQLLERRRLARLLEDAADQGKTERFALVLSAGFGFSYTDTTYTGRLHDFGFQDDEDLQPRVAVDIGYRVLPNLLLGLSYYNLQAREYSRDLGIEQHFAWTGHALSLFVQGDTSFGRRRLLTLFARLGVGASYAWTRFDGIPAADQFTMTSPSFENTTPGRSVVVQHFVRPGGFVSAGLALMPGRYLGFHFEVRYVLAPAIRNEFGEHHNLGGINLLFGVRIRTWE